MNFFFLHLVWLSLIVEMRPDWMDCMSTTVLHMGKSGRHLWWFDTILLIGHSAAF
jgi:hypothetical protein